MKAVVIHHNLNSPGGEATVAIETMQTLADLGYEIHLLTIQKPDVKSIMKSYGKTLPVSNTISLFPFKISCFGIYQKVLTAFTSLKIKNPDIIVNTNGGFLPAGIPENVPIMTYLHFPPSLLTDPKYKNDKYTKSLFWKTYFEPYKKISNYLIKKTLLKSKIIIANSKFTSDAVKEIYPDIQSCILHPPVNIERFDLAYRSNTRERKVLVTSRFSPEKQIENAIMIAKILSEKDVKFIILGSLIQSNLSYFNHIKKIIVDYGLENKILLIPNATFIELLDVMAESSIYLHTMQGEHFGVSIIEAMASGLVPIVPSYGGCGEIVPSGCKYNSIEEGAKNILKNMDNYNIKIKRHVHRLAENYSTTVFREKIKQQIEHMQAISV